jgi:hypothetical protein
MALPLSVIGALVALVVIRLFRAAPQGLSRRHLSGGKQETRVRK